MPPLVRPRPCLAEEVTSAESPPTCQKHLRHHRLTSSTPHTFPSAALRARPRARASPHPTPGPGCAARRRHFILSAQSAHAVSAPRTRFFDSRHTAAARARRARRPSRRRTSEDVQLVDRRRGHGGRQRPHDLPRARHAADARFHGPGVDPLPADAAGVRAPRGGCRGVPPRRICNARGGVAPLNAVVRLSARWCAGSPSWRSACPP